tara:strand:+ start:834 stop:1958 length:1125 start_codon:yes stop_codon:yes gene_type:complete
LKKLLFITGTRADFGKIEPLASIAKNRGYHIHFFVTGMHLLEKYGLTSIEVARVKGAKREEFINQMEGDSLEKILAKTIMGFSDYLKKIKPDMVLIHGDRVEALGAALVCASQNVRSAHIEGGEVSGTIDEVYRHCNTKLCTSHFVSSQSAKNRVVSLGEHPDRVFIIGSPELDTHKANKAISLADVIAYYEILWEEFGVFIFHSVTSELKDLKEQLENIFTALKRTKKNFVIIAPNNDPGSEMIFKEINKLPNERFKVIPSMRFSYFSILLKNAKLIVGNSSAGVREAPFLGTPSINIGSRQKNRSFSKSVTNYSYQNDASLDKLIEKKWGDKHLSDKSFGSGNSSKKFIKILDQKKVWSLKTQKTFFEKSKS